MVPSDTSFLPSKSYIYVCYKAKIYEFRAQCLENISFLEILKMQNPSKTTKNHSQGITSAIISCQRVADPQE